MLAHEAVRAEKAGSPYEAISYYRQAIRLMRGALELTNEGQVYEGMGGINTEAVRFYLKVRPIL